MWQNRGGGGNVPLTRGVFGSRQTGPDIGRGMGIAVPLNLERIDWMPSPPLAPDDGPIDTGHLARMTLGDAGLEREVLAMFSAQAAELVGKLAKLPSEALVLSHTLKGSARAIGAFAVADAAAALEITIRNASNPEAALAELAGAVGEARTAIDAILRRS